MKKRKYTLISPEGSYAIYAKLGNKSGNESRRHKRNDQLRLVPIGSGWDVSTGADGHTLARMEDDGNGADFWFDNRDTPVRLDYDQLQYLLWLVEAQRNLDPAWWDGPEWHEEKL